MARKEVGVNLWTFRLAVGWCWDPLLWHFKSGSGKNWILFGVFYNPCPEGDVRVLYGVLGPITVKVGW